MKRVELISFFLNFYVQFFELNYSQTPDVDFCDPLDFFFKSFIRNYTSNSSIQRDRMIIRESSALN